MIHSALHFLAKQLDDYLKVKNNNTDDKVSLINITNPTSGTVQINADQLGVSLINIEEERIFKSQNPTVQTENGFQLVNPEIKLNLYMLVTSHYTGSVIEGPTLRGGYYEGLMQLSHVISFFQARNVFTPESSPTLPTELRKLVVELFSFSFEQLYNFWSVVGGTYLPSVLYRIRLVSFNESEALQEETPVTSISVDTN